MPLTAQMKTAALRALEERRAHRPKRIDNAALHAGSPMYYYCTSCGWLADTLPENWFLGKPKSLCGECQAMHDLGWLSPTDGK